MLLILSMIQKAIKVKIHFSEWPIESLPYSMFVVFQCLTNLERLFQSVCPLQKRWIVVDEIIHTYWFGRFLRKSKNLVVVVLHESPNFLR